MKNIKFLSGVLSIAALLCAGSLYGATVLQAVTANQIYRDAENAGIPAFAKAMDAERNKLLQNGVKDAPAIQGEWYITNTYPSGALKDQLEPESNAFNPGDRWWKKADYADGQTHALQMPGRSALYLARTLKVENTKKVELGLGSDDGLAVFLDGKKIHENNASRGVVLDNDKVTLDLTSGQNHVVMLKIYNGGGAAGFSYRLREKLVSQPQWDDLCKKFPAETAAFNAINPSFGPGWLLSAKTIESDAALLKTALPEAMANDFITQIKEAGISDIQGLELVFKALDLKKSFEFAKTQIPLVSPDALLKAIDDLETNHPGVLENPAALREQVNTIKPKLANLIDRLNKNDASAAVEADQICKLQHKIAFASPAVKALKDILLIKRADAGSLGLTYNWQGNTSMGKHYDNEIGILNVRDHHYKSLYHPKNGGFVGDLELYFDGKKLLFTGISDKNRWQVYEINIDGSGLRMVTPPEFADVDNYEAMYLPDERIIFTSAATFVGVPCVAGSDYVGNIHIMDKDGKNIRRLCFDQDNNWCPVLLKDGRVLYLRWEYTDSAHYFSRVLMHMNPDGTAQNEFYGSNSYWPNCLFYARPLPGSTTQFVAIVSGHHGTMRAGELYMFDVTKGREETQGVVQQLKPEKGNSTMGLVRDTLVDNSWPKFLHPHPLSDKQFLVSAKPTRNSCWGVYIIDTFNNMTLLSQEKGSVLFEPVPVTETVRPPIIPDKVDLKKKDATVFIQDVYEGTGLPGVPRGTVKALRIFQYEYSYRDMGGHYAIGMEAGWDVRRVIGTVPVYEDGSANFVVPANIPFALQPLDKDGNALQQMRSWLVAMPGENVQCIGCHERQNQTGRAKRTIASRQAPSIPAPFYGQKRGFSFNREVQPVLNRYCIQCHDGKNKNVPDFSKTDIDPKGIDFPWQMSGYSYSYWALMPYVRRNGPEGNYKILIPGEFSPNTSELVQILKKGHHGVRMDAESWDKLNTWIDLNVPFHGTWTEVAAASGRKIPSGLEEKRKSFRDKYANIQEDIEQPVKGNPYDETPVYVKGEKKPEKVALTAKNWPFSEADAVKLQKAAEANGAEKMTLDLGKGEMMTFVQIPAGDFNMGSETGDVDELPVNTVTIDKPFWMAATEVTLGQYKAFDETHTNYIYDQHYKDQVRPGYDMDRTPDRSTYQPKNPAIRVNWNDAMAFCEWLSEKSSKKVNLPTEAQWEWAARAGTITPLWYGDLKTDFAKFANLADVSMKKMAVRGIDPQPMHNPNQYYAFLPMIGSVNDGWLHLAPVGTYKANPWGLYDMAGNVAEWCRDTYAPYPFRVQSVNPKDSEVEKTIRGGSWNDRPYRATSSFRLHFPAWQKVYNVGFRPIIED